MKGWAQAERTTCALEPSGSVLRWDDFNDVCYDADTNTAKKKIMIGGERVRNVRHPESRRTCVESGKTQVRC